MSIFFVLIIISSIVPSLSLASDKINQSFSKEEIEALLWLRTNTEKNSIIISTLNEGHLISALALKRNFIDSNFMFVEDIDQRLEDTSLIYTTTSQTQRIGLLNRYGIDYIYFSDRAKKEYKIQEIPFLDESCFKKIFSNNHVDIYESLCKIEAK